jgi:hypothetical protein
MPEAKPRYHARPREDGRRGNHAQCLRDFLNCRARLLGAIIGSSVPGTHIHHSSGRAADRSVVPAD